MLQPKSCLVCESNAEPSRILIQLRGDIALCEECIGLFHAVVTRYREEGAPLPERPEQAPLGADPSCNERARVLLKFVVDELRTRDSRKQPDFRAGANGRR
jgi:hypothetical protein